MREEDMAGMRRMVIRVPATGNDYVVDPAANTIHPAGRIDEAVVVPRTHKRESYTGLVWSFGMAATMVIAIFAALGAYEGADHAVRQAQPWPTVTQFTSPHGGESAKAKPPASLFSDADYGWSGVTWIVGPDLEPGTWEVLSASPDCAWDVTSTGQDDVGRSNRGGGHWRVSLVAGEMFETTQCGTWRRS